MQDSLFDQRGCLTEAGLAALSGAPPGRAPDAAAQHMAACRSCQERWLLRALTPEERARRSKTPRADAKARFWRIVVFAIVALTLAVGTLATLRLVLG